MIPAVYCAVADVGLKYAPVCRVIAARNICQSTELAILCDAQIRTLYRDNSVSKVGDLLYRRFPDI